MAWTTRPPATSARCEARTHRPARIRRWCSRPASSPPASPSSTDLSSMSAFPLSATAFTAMQQTCNRSSTHTVLPLSALLLLGGALGDRFGAARYPDPWRGTVRRQLGLLRFRPEPCPGCSTRARCRAQGAALLLPNSLAILGTAFSGEARGRAVGTWSAASSISLPLALYSAAGLSTFSAGARFPAEHSARHRGNRTRIGVRARTRTPGTPAAPSSR